MCEYCPRYAHFRVVDMNELFYCRAIKSLKVVPSSYQIEVPHHLLVKVEGQYQMIIDYDFRDMTKVQDAIDSSYLECKYMGMTHCRTEPVFKLKGISGYYTMLVPCIECTYRNPR